MIRDANEKDASAIVNVNVMGWINTYKGIFLLDGKEYIENIYKFKIN